MTRELLSAEDARILALESVTVRGHTCKVIVIAGERSAEQVRVHLEQRVGAVPRLMRRLDPATGPPAWKDDPGFSLERHVIDRGGLDEAGLRRLICTAMETPLDRGHPLWSMEVVSPLTGAGPLGPQSVLGAPLLELHSLAEIAHRHALRVAIVSASGRISFGLCADPDAIDGLDLIAQGIGREIDALGGAVGGADGS